MQTHGIALWVSTNRMATTLISQRQLADGDDEDWLFVVDVDDDDVTHVYRVPQILVY